MIAEIILTFEQFNYDCVQKKKMEMQIVWQSDLGL